MIFTVWILYRMRMEDHSFSMICHLEEMGVNVEVMIEEDIEEEEEGVEEEKHLEKKVSNSHYIDM